MPCCNAKVDVRQDYIDAPRLDLAGEESPLGLLSRLKSQNLALEKLRLALEDESETAVPGRYDLALELSAS